jgi:hypothetical protein
LEPALGTYVGGFGASLLGRITSLPVSAMAFLGSVALGHLHAASSEKNIFYNNEPVSVMGHKPLRTYGPVTKV